MPFVIPTATVTMTPTPSATPSPTPIATYDYEGEKHEWFLPFLFSGSKISVLLKHPSSKVSLTLKAPDGSIENRLDSSESQYIRLENWILKNSGVYSVVIEGEAGEYHLSLIKSN